jgi:hypothetical protein
MRALDRGVLAQREDAPSTQGRSRSRISRPTDPWRGMCASGSARRRDPSSNWNISAGFGGCVRACQVGTKQGPQEPRRLTSIRLTGSEVRGRMSERPAARTGLECQQLGAEGRTAELGVVTQCVETDPRAAGNPAKYARARIVYGPETPMHARYPALPPSCRPEATDAKPCAVGQTVIVRCRFAHCMYRL